MVESCYGALIAISETAYNTETNTTEIELGANGNLESIIRDGPDGNILIQKATPDILSCDELRTFWIKWDDGELAVGTGSHFESGEILRLPPPLNGKFSAISMATETDQGGRWGIVHETGMI